MKAPTKATLNRTIAGMKETIERQSKLNRDLANASARTAQEIVELKETNEHLVRQHESMLQEQREYQADIDSMREENYRMKQQLDTYEKMLAVLDAIAYEKMLAVLDAYARGK